MTEKQLIEGCQQRLPKAQQALYEKYAGKMLGVCLRYVSSRETARDLLHDGFVTVYSKIGDFRSEGSFEGWLRRVFVTTVLGYLRKSNNWSDVEDEKIAYNLENGEASTLEKMYAKDIMSVMAKMPEKYRAAINLYAIEGYSHREIAEILGISENTSRSHYSRAKVMLHKLLGDGAR